jgi:hypothetical protein
MNNVLTLKFLTIVFTLSTRALTRTLTLLLATITVVIRPQTLKNRHLRTVLHHGKNIAWLRVFQGSF